MTDPQRLLSSLSDADELERELLGSILRVEPPSGAKGEAWDRLSAQIAAVGLVTTVHGSAAASAASSSAAAAPSAGAASSSLGWGPLALKVLSSKLAVGLAVAGTALGASAVWLHVYQEKHEAPAKSVAVVSALQPQTEAQPVLDAPVPAELAPPTLPPADAPAKPNVEQNRKDRLSAESALLTRARAELRRGDAAAAQQSLDQLRHQFPKGMLGQEREVLTIEVLSARGNTDAARRRARAFIAAFPKSPHSAQLSRFAEAP
jgi:type IV secretory pathway VirB10-like protein